ncbi:hypothetical protein OSB04_001073 [Centaurea solstitialis]|uniref:CCT domain-containing protein n=1 Tax=Centaurea solstitialis TaxID=347529 RepID=A0AA38U8L5_9ASTR|nr:hypothetical protein OSB04_001073 [Centaurea solstitialis]
MVIQRSGSSHSIATQFHNNGFFNQPVSSPNEFLDSEGSSSTTMRRVFSAEDLQYVCRKTLADSRPRIRGRFARNDEIEKATDHQSTSQGGGEEGIDEEDDDNWMNNFLDSFTPNLIP